MGKGQAYRTVVRGPRRYRITTHGSSGEDLIMGVQTKKIFPYSIECKNQEAVNVWKAYEQCSSNTSPNVESLVIIKRNKSKPLALVDAEYFINLHKHGDS